LHKGRLEAFSDGVIAILITIMVLELKVPHGNDFAALQPMFPTLLSYVLSFIFLGIYWNNHHHLFQAAQRVNGATLWANLHLLFWLSLIPFVTAWMGENGFPEVAVAVYGFVLLMCGVAFFILAQTLLRNHSRDSVLAKGLGDFFKGKISVVFYAIAIPLAFVNAWISYALYILVAIIWLVPDRRIEKVVGS
jgi:uncharacterized membrane protein